MAGPKKKSKKPSESQLHNELMNEESESGTYQGQQVGVWYNSCNSAIIVHFRKYKLHLKDVIPKDKIFME